MTALDEALSGIQIPPDIKKILALLPIEYFSFEGEVRAGHLVVHKEVLSELKDIFKELFEMKFPIKKVTPVSFYNWSDEKSMEDNNTHAFNYRPIFGTDRLSNHSFGRAIDINPQQNPFIIDGKVFPERATRNVQAPGTFIEGGRAVRSFTERGWTWGGTWENPKDWHHFEKPKK